MPPYEMERHRIVTVMMVRFSFFVFCMDRGLSLVILG